MNQDFSLLVNHPGYYKVLQDVVTGLPADCEVYLIGGAVRNALYRHYHGETLRQRDFDQIVLKGSADYLAYLKSLGFFESKVLQVDQIIMVYDLVPDADPTSYDDSVVFDTHTLDGTTVMDNLLYHSGHSINGFALSMRDIFDPNWAEKVIELPGAKEDLQNKQLHINQTGYASDPANIFACLRFVSAGFTPPPKEEIAQLLVELPKLNSDRFGRNITKAYEYIGGEAAAHELVAKLGIQGNLFDESDVKNGKVHL